MSTLRNSVKDQLGTSAVNGRSRGELPHTGGDQKLRYGADAPFTGVQTRRYPVWSLNVSLRNTTEQFSFVQRQKERVCGFFSLRFLSLDNKKISKGRQNRGWHLVFVEWVNK